MILCDLDGLGANFHEGVERHIPWVEFKAMSDDEQHTFLIEMFKKEPDFFNTLPKIEQFIELITFLESSGERWMICTSAGEAHPSYMKAKTSKLAWLERCFGIEPEKVIVTPNSEAKLQYANPNTILIDDWKVNCERFEEEGGFSVHVEANTYDVKDVIARVSTAIEQMHLLEVNI